jgi:hypothetical protein
MPLPDAAVAHYAAQQRQVQATVLLVQRLWRQITGGNLDEEWAGIAHRLTLIVGAAQLGAASAGAAYVPAVLAEIGQSVDPDAEVNPKAWAGVASDGRPLESLLYSPVVQTKESLAGGMALQGALQAGSESLKKIVATQVQDAGRGAASVAIAARPGIGWTRVEGTPCCQRCAVLTGKWFKWNQGFLRHPHCSGRHVPCPHEDHAELAQKIRPDQIKDLTDAERKALAEGADLNQVINARRKRSGLTTAEGTTRRGLFGRQSGGKPRLTPDGVYRLSATREEAVARLKANAYLI